MDRPPVRLVDLGLAPWLQTQSVYHALAEAQTAASPDTIVLARPARPYLCLGYHQELESVLDREACATLGLPIVRRRVGGGATYLDSDQLFYQCIFHHTRVPATVHGAYALLLSGPVAALNALGLPAELRGDNEIEVNGRRIAGIGGGRLGQAAVVVGNVLFDFNYAAMSRAWRAPGAGFRRLASEALRERVTTLQAELAEPPSIPALQTTLIQSFAEALGRPLEIGALTAGERARMAAWEKRLVSPAWLNLHADGGRPMTSLKIAREVFIRSAEATVGAWAVRAALRVREGVIESAALESVPARDWAAAAAALRGASAEGWALSLESWL